MKQSKNIKNSTNTYNIVIGRLVFWGADNISVCVSITRTFSLVRQIDIVGSGGIVVYSLRGG